MSCKIELSEELLETIDKKIKTEGGTFEDWITFSVIKLMLLSGGYSYAFKAYLKTDFTEHTTREAIEKDIIETLKTLDK